MAKFKTADVERERPGEPFEVECESGNTYTLPHPKEIPGRDLIALDTGQPGTALSVLLGDDFENFMDEPEIDGYALEAVLGGWMAHYGLDVNRGNGRGSRRPSTATAKRSKPTSRSAASP